MYIIIGLGNPGRKYEHTRHNMGFITVDKLAERASIKISTKKFKGLIAETFIAEEKAILVKPQTYMNLSGDCVQEIVNYYKVPHDKIIIVYDDIDIPLGIIRIRKAGGPGTHNGMKSVVSALGFEDFPRIRIGIGGGESDNLINHVIGKVSSEEKKILNGAAGDAANCIEDIIKFGLDNSMNMHNGRKSL